MKYIIKNCPALSMTSRAFKKCFDRGYKIACEDRDDCIIKKLIEMCNDACNKACLCDALESATVPVRDIFALFDTESELKRGNNA